MCHVGRNDDCASGADDLRRAADRDLELSLDDVPDLVVGMVVLVNRRARVDGIVRERHVLRVEETADAESPSWPDLITGNGIARPHSTRTRLS